MSMALPTYCANPDCRETAIRPIHCSSQKVAIDAVDGPAVFDHHVTYRCANCGHTWSVQGYSSEVNLLPVRTATSEVASLRTSSRAW